MQSVGTAAGKYAIDKAAKMFGQETKGNEAASSQDSDFGTRSRTAMWYEVQEFVQQVGTDPRLTDDDIERIVNPVVIEQLEYFKGYMSNREFAALSSSSLKEDLEHFLRRLNSNYNTIKKERLEEQIKEEEEQRRWWIEFGLIVLVVAILLFKNL